MPVVAVLDYDMGNLHSACKGLELAGATPIVTNDPTEVARADGLVLPGVGSFDPAMHKFRATNPRCHRPRQTISGHLFGLAVAV